MEDMSWIGKSTERMFGESSDNGFGKLDGRGEESTGSHRKELIFALKVSLVHQ
jgi:hypothetical protein